MTSAYIGVGGGAGGAPAQSAYFGVGGAPAGGAGGKTAGGAFAPTGGAGATSAYFGVSQGTLFVYLSCCFILYFLCFRVTIRVL